MATRTEELENFSKKIMNGEIEAELESKAKEASASSETTNDTYSENAKDAHEQEASKSDDLFGDDEPVIVGFTKEELNEAAKSENNTKSHEMSIQEEYNQLISEQMADMANKNPGEYDTKAKELLEKIMAYRKKLIIENGFTTEEADAAARNRTKKQATEMNTQFIKDNPDLAVVKIDKTNVDKVEFTEEEKKKLSKVKSIRLVEVEDKDLLAIPIKKAESEDVIFNAIHRLTCNISKYELPMINTFDNCEFSGATTVQLLQAVYDENDSEYRRISAELELIYDKFQGSTTIDKYDAEGNIIFTKEDFAKWFNFFDINTALYAIYVASSTEIITSQFSCDKNNGGCDKDFEYSYNCKALLNYDDITDEYKGYYDSILKSLGDRDRMRAIKDEARTAKRFKSQFTGNIYQISAPSIARALNIYRYINPKDTYARYLAYYGLLLEHIYIQDPKDGSYIDIDYNNPRQIMKFLFDITDTEIRLIDKVIQNFYYRPKFVIKTKCPHCGKEHVGEFNIDDLVFLKVQGTEAEIE
jgi:hypothetical protein